MTTQPSSPMNRGAGEHPEAVGEPVDPATPAHSADPARPVDPANLAGPADPAAELPTELPADPDAYDSPRATQARARGLAAPYIAGGDDPDIEITRREERKYFRLLIVMIIVLILLGFVLGILENLLRGAA